MQFLASLIYIRDARNCIPVDLPDLNILATPILIRITELQNSGGQRALIKRGPLIIISASPDGPIPYPASGSRARLCVGTSGPNSGYLVGIRKILGCLRKIGIKQRVIATSVGKLLASYEYQLLRKTS